MKLYSIALAGVAVATGAPVFADTIDFAQFGPEYTNHLEGSSGLTANGVSFTVNSTATRSMGGMMRFNQGSAWDGSFIDGTPVLFSGFSSGTITLAFASGLSSLTAISLATNESGPYTATASFYNGATLLTALSYNAISSNVSGTAGHFASYSAGGPLITSVVFSATNDGFGIAIAGGAVPEPATWGLMITGFGMVGAAARRRRRTAIA